MTTIADAFNIQYHPTVSFELWVNGTVERLNRDILAAVRATLSELKLAPRDWASVIDIIPSVLNEAPESRPGRNTDGWTRTPLELMIDIRPCRAILQIL